MKILVTGANGQLGKCIKDASTNHPNHQFIFASRAELNIEDFSSVANYFATHRFDYCINAAAYTNVEKAESDSENAFLVNAEAVKNVAIQCEKNTVTLLQVSTDYVFNGEKTSPYSEEDKVNPINVYGASKLKGEQYIIDYCKNFFIIRTSWLYSQYGHNFLNTISKHLATGKNLTITTEQTGTPTNANDLAIVLLKIITLESKKYGIYHFSNQGNATWYDFAKEILTLSKINNNATVDKTNHYRTFAERPKYSILNNNKFNKTFNVSSIEWKTSLKTLINKN